MFPQPDSELLQLLEVVRELADGKKVYLVGGAIRDLLLGLPAKDLDFVMPEGSIELARAVSRRLGGVRYTLDDLRHSGRVILRHGEKNEQVLDFTSFIGRNLEQDLRQRDFTINAMALDLDHPDQLIDLLGGEADLRMRKLRICGPESLTSDPLRVLRGVRLISSYNLVFETQIVAEMRVAIKKVGAVSGERIRDELMKCLRVPNFERTAVLFGLFGVYDQLRLLVFGVDPIEPELLETDRRLLAVLERLAFYLFAVDPEEGRQPGIPIISTNSQLKAYLDLLDEPLQGGRRRSHLLLLCSILLHLHPLFDRELKEEASFSPGVFAEQISRGLLIGHKEEMYFKAVSSGFLRIAELSKQELEKLDYYRFFREFGSYGLDSALMALVEEEVREGKFNFRTSICESIFSVWFDEQNKTVNPPSLVDGMLLQRELQIGPGAEIGFLLEAIRQQQVLGRVNTTAEALDFARESMKGKK